jgi:hypothetical protein
MFRQPQDIINPGARNSPRHWLWQVYSAATVQCREKSHRTEFIRPEQKSRSGVMFGSETFVCKDREANQIWKRKSA